MPVCSILPFILEDKLLLLFFFLLLLFFISFLMSDVCQIAKKSCYDIVGGK